MSSGYVNRIRYVIGQRPECDIIVQDRGVSGAHSCLIVEPDNSFTLVDIGSTTGTWLFRNGDWEPVVQAPVSTTDRIRIGPFETTVAELLLRLQERPDNQQSPRQKLFMSYRRADTEQVSGRIFDYLAERYGSEHVFFDTEAIPGAVDFRARIRTAMNESFAALAIIGSKWNRRGKLQTMLSWLGRQPDADHVVVEIEMAIMGRVPIVPLLAGDATMPSSKDLPASIQSISNLNALRVRSGRDFKGDMEAVVSTLARFKT